MTSCLVIYQNESAVHMKLMQELCNHGYEVTELNWRKACLPQESNRFDLIIVEDAKHTPAGLKEYLYQALSNGKNVLMLGGVPFNNEYYMMENRFVSLSNLSDQLKDGGFSKRTLLDFSNPKILDSFVPDTNNPDSKEVELTASLSIAAHDLFPHCLHWSTDRFYINESFEAPVSFETGENVIGFFHCADAQTRIITIKLIQEDGFTYRACVTPEADFSFAMLDAHDFTCMNGKRGEIPPLVDFQKVKKIQFGHALSHAYSCAGEHNFYIADLCTGTIPFLKPSKITIDGLCPQYRFFPMRNMSASRVYENQAILSPAPIPKISDVYSFSPRAQGLGIDHNRRSRFIPLIETIGADGLQSGFLAYMILNRGTSPRPYALNGSALTVFTVNDESFYLDGGIDFVMQAADAMCAPVLLVEGGTDSFIYQEEQTEGTLGALCSVKSAAGLSGYEIHISAPGAEQIWPLTEAVCISEQNGFSYLRMALPFSPMEGSVSVALVKDGVTKDRIVHSVSVYHPKPAAERRFASLHPTDNEVIIDGKPVRFFGVNYMPSYDATLDDFYAFEHYVSSFSYDPDVIERDLLRIRAIGMNAVSVFYYFDPSVSSSNILHLISRCQAHGLYVNLSIRPHANPFDFSKEEVEAMIKTYHFDEIDTIVGYDIAWERYVGTYEPCYGNFNGRKSFDAAWRFFIQNRYGGAERAESLFGCALPRNESGEIIGLSDDQLRHDGEHTKMAAAYRCCIDMEVRRAHTAACNFIRSIDQNHLISARSGDASTIPLVDPGIYGYDYDAMASGVDTLSPESYALSDDINSLWQGVFTNTYARYAKNNTVIQWMEFGKSIWTGSNFNDNTVMRNRQASYYRAFFDMLLAGHTAGAFCWWWFGGYRQGENSDFGIIDPDGSDRPVTKVIREYANRFIHAPAMKAPEKYIKINRDLHADGLRSVYQSVQPALFDAIRKKEMIAFCDDSFGCTSADVPLTETGGMNASGCSPRYLDSFISSVQIKVNEQVFSVSNGGCVSIPKNTAFTVSLTMQNTTDALWLSEEGYGQVQLVSEDTSCAQVIPLFEEKRKNESAVFMMTYDESFEGTIHAALHANGRTAFGERFRCTIHRA